METPQVTGMPFNARPTLTPEERERAIAYLEEFLEGKVNFRAEAEADLQALKDGAEPLSLGDAGRMFCAMVVSPDEVKAMLATP